MACRSRYGSRMDELLGEVLAAVEPHRGSGRVADYIPALDEVDPRKF